MKNKQKTTVMTFKEALEIVLDLAGQGALDENQLCEATLIELQPEIDRQNEAFGVVSDFMQNCDLSEFDA